MATPYGIAVQGGERAALTAREDVAGGARLWRMGTMGKRPAAEAQFWSLEHPLSPGFASRYGIPAENVARPDFIGPGVLKPGAGFVTRAAPGVGDNVGGGIEAVVAPGDVLLDGFSTGPFG